MAGGGLQTRRATVARRLVGGLSYLLILPVLYIASVGPLVWLESCGLGSEKSWSAVRETAYFPVYRSWTHGSRWIGKSLSWYTARFEAAGSMAKILGPRSNDEKRLIVVWSRKFKRAMDAQSEWERQHPIEARKWREREALVCVLYDEAAEIREEEEDSWEGWW